MSRSVLQAFENLISDPIPTNFAFRSLYVVKGRSRFSLMLRYLFSAFQNILFLLLSSKEAVLIYPFNNLFSLKAINFINKFLKRRILIFCHGEMEVLVEDFGKNGILHRTLSRLCWNFFLNQNFKISEGIHFCVIGDVVKENLSKVLSSNVIERFICIDHPYIFDSKLNCKTSTDGTFHIGTVGTLSKIKGLDTFVSFVSKIDSSIKDKIKISITGHVTCGISALKELDVDVSSQNESLTRRDFKERIDKLDLILFFYSGDSYKITASGAILDALFYEKPILALRNDYFEYIFRKIGDFGFLANSLEEMIDELSARIKDNENKRIDFKTLKNKLTPELISLQLLSELSRIGYLNN